MNSLNAEHQRNLAKIDAWYQQNKNRQRCRDAGSDAVQCERDTSVDDEYFDMKIKEKRRYIDAKYSSNYENLDSAIFANQITINGINRILNNISKSSIGAIKSYLSRKIY